VFFPKWRDYFQQCILNRAFAAETSVKSSEQVKDLFLPMTFNNVNSFYARQCHSSGLAEYADPFKISF